MKYQIKFKKYLSLIIFIICFLITFYCCKNLPTSPQTPSLQIGSIQVNSNPIGANIYLDGSDTNKTTNALLTNIQPGPHSIRLCKDCYKGYETTVNVEAGQTCEVSADLQFPISTSPYVVYGQVYYSTSPLTNIQVELVQGSGTNPPLQITHTNSDGCYYLSGVAPGIYYVKVYGPTNEFIGWTASLVEVKTSDIQKNMDLPKIMVLLSPSNGAIVYSLHPTLEWQANNEANHYRVQINVTQGWEHVEDGSTISTKYTVQSELTPGTNYTWQVNATDDQGHWVGTTYGAYRFTVSAN